MTTPELSRAPDPPALLLMARRWAETADSTTLDSDGDDVAAEGGELALLRRYLDAVNPFQDATSVIWLSGHQWHPATVRHRMASNEWLLRVDDPSRETGHSVRASSAEIAIPPADIGDQTVEDLDHRERVPIEVCVDSAEENMVCELALAADHVLPERWNGWARPIATAAALADFLRRWRHNDPNGVWGEALELEDRLVCTRSDDDYEDSFPLVGANSAGLRLYDFTGWVWVKLPTF